MSVREVRMRVRDRLVPMRMRVAGSRLDREIVRMPVMFIMHVLVRMEQRFMRMFVFVPFGQMQPHAQPHQRAGNDQAQCNGFTEQRNRDQRANERRHRKIGAGTRGAEMAQRYHEK